jgi:murein endopeptidase
VAQRLLAVALAAIGLLTLANAAQGKKEPRVHMHCRATPRQAPATPPIVWRVSQAVGRPDAGRLVNGVRLPAKGRDFFTWSWLHLRAPNGPGRRWGTAHLVRTILRVVSAYRREHPGAARVGITDLSRRHGGNFGKRFGKPGHVSHQNGLDVDVLYPRRDHRECAVRSWKDIDRPLAQDLVDRFVAAGASFVLVGLRTGLDGPVGVLYYARTFHGDHFHVRLPLPRS